MPPNVDALLRPKITIKTLADSTLHTYDSFDLGAADINIAALSLSEAYPDAPEITFLIEDSGNTLDENVINGCKVFVDLGKTQGGLARQFSGYVRQKQIIRSDTGTFDMALTTLGSKVRFTERISNFTRMAKRTAVDSASYDSSDSTMSISQVFTDLITKTDHRPTGRAAESFTTTGIQSMSEVLPGIKAQYREDGMIANEICACNGAIWGVDGNDDVFLRFPTTSPSGVVIKDTVSASDIAATAYIRGGWTITDSIMKDEGFSNVLYGRGGTELIVDQFSSTDASSTSLHDRDLAIQFTPGKTFNADVFSVVVHKVGTPVGQSGKLQAVLRVDEDDEPGSAITSGYADLTKLVVSPGSVIQIPLSRNNSAFRNLQVDKKHWLQLSRVGGDASNTVHWHRDTGTSGLNAYRTASTWTTQAGSYTFVYGQLQSRRVLTEAADGASIATYNAVESMIDADWINDGRTMDKYLSSILRYTARCKRIIDIPMMTIPDTLPQVGQTVELIDSKCGFAAGNVCEVIGVDYNFNAASNGIGANTMSIKLVQYPKNERLLNRA